MTKQNKNRTTKAKLLSKVGVTAFLACSMALSAHAQANETTYTFDMPSQSLNSALKDFGVLADKQIMFSKKIVDGKQVAALHGELSSMAALDQLLSDTGLEYKVTASGVILVVETHVIKTGQTKEVEKQEETPSFRLAQLDQEEIGTVEALDNRDTDEEASIQSSKRDEIVVTGSRIKRAASQLAAQVIVLDRADLANTGEISLERALRQLPQNVNNTGEFGAAIGSAFGGAVNVTAGSNINLRGLGGESTLILVDGRRIGQSGLFGGATDISGIPLDSIERVEILLDGASSIYGSDAVGGVVNIILRKDYKGLEASYTVGLPSDGGFQEHVANLSGGTTWENGSLRASYEFSKITELDGSERPVSTLTSFNSPGNVTSFLPLFYQFQGQNFLLSELPVPSFFPGVEPIFNAPIPAGQNGVGLTAADFTTSGLVLGSNDLGRGLIPAQERHTFQAGISQSFNLFAGEEVDFTGDIYYSTKDVSAGSGAAVFAFTVPTANPFNPFEDAFGVPGSTNVTTLIPELPSPFFETDQDIFRWNLGLNGEVGNWNWSLGGNQSREKIDTTHFNTAVDVTATSLLVAGGLNVFASDLVAANGLPVLLQLQNAPLTASSINKQTTINAGIDGALFKIWGGDVHVAVGAEWSKTSLDTQSEASVGLFAISSSVPLGAFEQVEVSSSRQSFYGEILIPLVSKENAVGLVKQLDLTGSVRSDDYDQFDGATTYSLGAIWSPDEQLRFKINYSTSFVVPTPQNALVPVNILDFTTFPFPIPIPVVDQNGVPTGALETYSMLISGGNPDLEPETATSLSARVELTPDFVPGLILGASWHETSYDNRIGASPVVGAGVFLPDLQNFPNLLFRDATGGIVWDVRATNITAVEIEGIDYDFRYTRETSKGQFNLSGNLAYTSKWRQVNSPGAEPLDLLAEFLGSNRNVIPKYRYSANLNWSHRGMSVNFGASSASTTATISPNSDSANSIPLGTFVRRANKRPFLADMSVKYDFEKANYFAGPDWLNGTSLSLRVVNILDRQPQVIDTLEDTGETVNEVRGFVESVNANIADPRGRMFYLTVKKKF